MARPSCFRLFEQLIRAAASRTFWTAGNNNPINTAMMAITTNNSIRVNADRLTGLRDMIHLKRGKERDHSSDGRRNELRETYPRFIKFAIKTSDRPLRGRRVMNVF